MIQIIKDWFTARNGIDYSLTKLIGLLAAVTMLARFWQLPQPDYIGLGMGIAVIMAALAGKYLVETRPPIQSNQDGDENPPESS